MKQETELLEKLVEEEMEIIGPDQGLDYDAFREKVRSCAWPKYYDVPGMKKEIDDYEAGKIK